MVVVADEFIDLESYETELRVLIINKINIAGSGNKCKFSFVGSGKPKLS